jgi:predicted sulfurtransferase
MLDTLLYVSYSTLYIPNDAAIVDAIVAQSRRRNASLRLTGALLFTHQHFAQYIEGPEAAIADLMASIRRDPRHRDLTIQSAGRTHRRLFAGWDMAYAGPSETVAAQVAASLSSLDQRSDCHIARDLVRLMFDLALEPRPDMAA